MKPHDIYIKFHLWLIKTNNVKQYYYTSFATVKYLFHDFKTWVFSSFNRTINISCYLQIQLLEGQEGWNIRANMTRTGDYWLERSQDSTVIDDMILVIWFPTFNDAEKWVISERKFKTPSFPEPYGSDVMILPLNDSQPQGDFILIILRNVMCIAIQVMTCISVYHHIA